MPNGTQQPPRTRGPTFGERLKGVGRAIGRGIRAAPGYVYREAIRPEAERIYEKFTEPIVRTPTVRRRPLPGTAELAEAYGTGVEPYRPVQRTTTATAEGPPRTEPGLPRFRAEPGAPRGLRRGAGRATGPEPYRAVQRTRLKRRPGTTVQRARRIPAQYLTKGGAKGVVIPLPGETIDSPSYRQRVAKQEAERQAAARRVRLEPRKPQTRAEAKKRPPLTAGKEIGEYVEVIGRVPPPPAPRAKGMPRPGRKRKFSPRKTTREVGKAAAAAQEPLDIGERIDTTAMELARATREEEIAREQARVEAILREGRRPRRERARYRYRIRGLNRTNNRGR